MRIVFLSPSGELGGAETALLDILAAIREARPDWRSPMIAASTGPLVAKAAAYGDAAAMPFPDALARLGEWGTRGSILTPPPSRRGTSGRFCAGPELRATAAEAARDFNPDIIHSNGLKMHLLGARVRPSAREARVAPA